MKKVLYVVAAFAALAFTSCNAEPDIDIDTNGGEGLAFVHFAYPSEEWLVAKDDKSYDHEIYVGQTAVFDKDVTYQIEIGENTTGVEGKNFKIATRSVTIPAGEYLGSFIINVPFDPEGEDFDIEILLDVDEALVNPTYGVASYVSVFYDKTIDWAWLEGAWKGSDYCYYSAEIEGDPYSMTITKKDEETCVVNGLWGCDFDLEGKVDFETRTITFETNVYMDEIPDYECELYFIAVDPSADYDCYYTEDDEPDMEHPVTATMSAKGIVIDNWDALMVGGQYDGYTYGGGYRTTLTR